MASHDLTDGDAERQRDFLDAMLCSGDSVITTDINENVRFLNPAAEFLTGWKEREARGKPLLSVFHVVNDETRLPIESPASQALQEGTAIDLTCRVLLIGKDGAEREVEGSAAPVRTLSGDIFGVLLVFRDITEKRRNERHVQEAPAKVRLSSSVDRP